jgi:hypothetical protein
VPLPTTLDELDIPAVLDLGALLVAQAQRLPVAPTHRGTFALLGRLRDIGAIELPWPDPRWAAPVDARETPLEAIQWRLTRGFGSTRDLTDAAIDRLRQTRWDETSGASGVAIWRELSVMEGERYFEYQLAKHHLDPQWAQDIGYVQQGIGAVLSAANWRYCAWATVRHATSLMAQALRADPAGLRQAMFADLRRRALALATGEWTQGSFAPRQPLPESARSRLFATDLSGLGPTFWTSAPTLPALLASRPSR